MGAVEAAAGLGVAWVILCVCCAAGLFLGERLLIMARLHCDWADAGTRQRIRAKRHYPAHRKLRVSSKPVLAPVRPGAIERADQVLDHTHVITPVQDETVITAVPVVTQTFVRPVATDVRPCCGTREGTGHLASCLGAP